MIEKSPEPFSMSTHYIDTWKLKLPSIHVALPTEFLVCLGQVVAAWGLFETAFDEFISALLKANAINRSSVKLQSFEQRVLFYRSQLTACFEEYPRAFSYLSALIGEAEELQIKRNVLVHGRFLLEIKTDADLNGIVTLIASGERKKQVVTDRYSFDEMASLYYRIAHLAGRMDEFRRPILPRNFSQWPSYEISRVQDFLAKNHPAHPTH